ncbi:unnamed protein product [Amoebophrya sp. A25]|nr:unnamed protein product [Amoebophrya sp. A25]|eukprot:GSA25T00001185001.1
MPKAAKQKDLGNVEIGDFKREIYQQEKELDSAAQAVARENAMVSAAILYVGLQAAIERGAFDGVDTEAIVAELSQFKEDGLELSKGAIEFLRDNASAVMKGLDGEETKAVLNGCKNLADLGAEQFQVLGKFLSDAAAGLGSAVGDIPWDALGDNVGDMAVAAAAAFAEAGRCAGKLMSDAWEQLSAEDQFAAAGGDDDKAAGISKALEEMSKTGAGLAADVVEALPSICDKLKDQGVQLLQKAVAVLKRAGDDPLIGELWDKLGEVVAALSEAGREVAAVAIENVGPAMDVVQEFSADLMSGAAAEAAAENAKIAGAILLNALAAAPDVAEEAIASLKKLKEDAAPLVGRALAQVKSSLNDALSKVPDVDLEKLQKAVAYAAQCGMAGMHDLFEAISSFVSGAIANRPDLPKIDLPPLREMKEMLIAGAAIVAFASVAPLIGMAAGIALAAEAVKVEDLKKAGEVMLDALNKLKEDGAEVADDVLDALTKMKEEGVPMAKEASSAVGGFLSENLLDKVSDEDVEKLQKAVGAAAKAGVEGMKELFDAIQVAVDAAIEAGRELAKVDWASIAAGAGGMIGQGAALVTDGIEDLQPLYKMARSEVTDAMNALVGATVTGCAACMDLLKLEIFRDVFQALGVFFARLFAGVSGGLTATGTAIWGFIGNLIAIDWGEIIPVKVLIIVAIVALVIVAIILVGFFIWFLYIAITEQTDALREGHEAENWVQKQKEQQGKVWKMGMVLTAALSIYLPLARTSFEILYCDVAYKWFLADNLKEDILLCDSGLMVGIAVFFLLIFVIPLPILAFWLVSKNKPQGSPENPDVTYDEDGFEVPFTDKLYHERVMTDPDQLACPYRSLYLGFERKWAFYKVAMMLFKFALVMPIIFAATKYSEAEYVTYQQCIDKPEGFGDIAKSPPAVGVAPGKEKTGCEEYMKDVHGVKPNPMQGLATLIVVALFAGFSTYSAPFVDPNSDRMDISGRVAMTVTVAIALVYALATPKIGGGLDVVLGITLNAANAVNFIFLVGCLLVGFPCLRSWYKNKTGRIDFADTGSRNTRFLSCKEAIPGWDLAREIKHRIWHSFWNTVLLNACGEEVAARMLELKAKTRSFGLEKIKMHWAGFNDAEIAALRMEVRQQWEGVDLYWDDATGTLDKNLDSASNFGKMYVTPYPFHMVMVYDDCDDVSFIWGNEKLKQFLELNQRPDIVEKVGNRRRFRALAAADAEFELPFDQIESETVPDGTEEYQDSEGNTKTRVVFSTVTFTCYYTNGKVALGANTSKAMAAGFKLSMTYCDGYGDAIKPRTGEPVHFSNRVCTKGRDHLGVDDSFDTNGRMSEVFAASGHLWRDQLDPLLDGYATYRTETIERFEALKGILHNGFWFYVYNNEKITRPELLTYLNEFETNPVLKSFGTDHQAGLNFLYLRMQCVAHPLSALWFVLWDDIWEENKDMIAFRDLEADIAPSSGQSIAYRPMEREKLVEWLKERNLYGSKGCCGGDNLFTDDMLDVIYERMEQEKQKSAV